MSGPDVVSGTGVQAFLEVGLAAPPADLLVRQRTRLADRLARLDATGWHRPTRCPLWDVADVVAHLGDATEWALAATGGRGGAAVGPGATSGFDPATTPHEQVLAGRGRAPQLLLTRLEDETRAFADHLHAAGEPELPAAPWVGGHRYTPGLVGLHILWDSWLHELDLETALGCAALPPCPLELDACAAYGTFFAGLGARRILPPGEDLELHVELDALTYHLQIGDTVRIRRAEPGARPPRAHLLRGPAVATVEALAGRGELADVVEGDARGIAALSALGARMRATARPAAAAPAPTSH